MGAQSISDRPFNIFETGGTIEQTKNRDDFKIDYTAFSDTLSDEKFPVIITDEVYPLVPED